MMEPRKQLTTGSRKQTVLDMKKKNGTARNL